MTTSLKPAIQTPTSSKGVTKADSTDSAASRQSVAAIALNMAWQLMVVFLVPIVGGHFLDTKLKSDPTWTVVGLVVAMLGMIVIVRQTIQALNQYLPKNSAEDKN